MQLTDAQRETLLQYTLYAEQWFSSRGLAMHVQTDFNQFQQLLSHFGYERFEHRNPGFDPRHTDVDASNALFIWIEQDGQPVATVAGRAVDVDDIGELFRSGRIFYGRGGKPADFQCDLLTDRLDGLHGRLAVGASAFVVPSLQNRNAPAHLRGIATRIVLLIRSLLHRRFEPDYYTALIRDTLVGKGMDRGTYRHQRGAEPWLKALDGDIYGILERPDEVVSAIALYLAESQSTGAETKMRPVTVTPLSEVGQTPPM